MPAWTPPTTFVAATTLTAAQLNTNVRDNTTHLYDLFYTVWTAFTPTLGGTSASLGNGSLTCHYMQAGKLVIARYILLGGSTTNLSTDALTLTLPVTARDPGNYRIPVGTGLLWDSTVATYELIPYIDHTIHPPNDRIKFAHGSGAMYDLHDTNPITSGFDELDVLSAFIMYEAA